MRLSLALCSYKEMIFVSCYERNETDKWNLILKRGVIFSTEIVRFPIFAYRITKYRRVCVISDF